MLILATGTLSVQFAARVDPVRRWRDDSDQIRGGKPLPNVNNFDFDPFAGNYKRDKDDKVLKPPDAVTTERDRGDVEFEVLAPL